MDKKDAKKYLAWYWLSITALILLMLDVVIGGLVGALFAIGGQLLLLLSLIEAARGGFIGGTRTQKISTASRIGAFLVALITALTMLTVYSLISSS